MHNFSLLPKWRKDNVCMFSLLGLVHYIPIPLLLYPLCCLQLLLSLIYHLLLLLLILIIILLPLQYHLQSPLHLLLLHVIRLVGALIITTEPVLIPDINMKYFTLQSLIPNYPIKMRFLPIMQLFILTSKIFLFTGKITLHVQLVTKLIRTIHIEMKLCIEINLNNILHLWRKNCTTVES